MKIQLICVKPEIIVYRVIRSFKYFNKGLIHIFTAITHKCFLKVVVRHETYKRNTHSIHELFFQYCW